MDKGNFDSSALVFNRSIELRIESTDQNDTLLAPSYNGLGTIITTEECLMDNEIQVRNKNFSREDYEDVFSKYLGGTNVIWLNKGIAGDDTHGHVDDITRFVNPNTVVSVMESHPYDPNYIPIIEYRELLEVAKLVF